MNRPSRVLTYFYRGGWGCILLLILCLVREIHGAENVESLSFEHIPVEKVYRKGMRTMAVVVPNASFIKDVVVYYAFTESKAAPPQNLLKAVVLQRSGVRFQEQIPVPATERIKYFQYFIRFQSQGETTIYPKPENETDGRLVLNFLRAEVLDDRNAPKISLLKPEEGKGLSGKNLIIQYGIDDSESGINPTSIKFVLNGVDLTKAGRLRGNIFEFKPDKPLPPGEFKHSLEVEDMAGSRAISKTSAFKVKTEKELLEEDKKWTGEGSFNATYDSNLQPNRNEDFNGNQFNDNASRTYTIQYKAEKDDTKIELGPAIISDSESTPGNRTDKISFGVTKGNLETRWGDISSEISTYTISTANAGAFIAYKTDAEPKSGTWEYRLSGGETQAGYNSTSDGIPGKFSRNSFGNYVGYNIRKDLKVFGAYQISQDDEDSIEETEGIEAYRNQSGEVGTEVAFEDLNLKLGAKYAIAFTDQLRLNKGKQGGYAMNYTANHSWKSFDLTSDLTYDQTSPSFNVFSGSGGSPDTRRIALSNAKNLLDGKLSLNFSNDFSHDNLLSKKPQTTYSYTTTNGFNLNFPKKPTLNYTNSIVLRESIGTGEAKTKNTTISHSTGTNYGYTWYIPQNANLNLSLVTVDDESRPTPADPTLTLGIAPGYSLDPLKWFNIAYNFTYNDSINQKTDESNLSLNHSIAFNMKFFKDTLTEGLTFTKSTAYQRKPGEKEKLTSASYSITSSTSYNITDKISSSVNLSYSINPPTEEIVSYPGSFTAGFQFNTIF